METRFCLFCARANPGDASFCNECGTPLHLKPCRYCDAVNARTADRCYRCEAALPTETVEAAGDERAREEVTAATAGDVEPLPLEALAVGATVAVASVAEHDAPRDVVARAFGGEVATRDEPQVGRSPPPRGDPRESAVNQEPLAAAQANDEHFAGADPTTVDDSARWSMDTSRLAEQESASEVPQYRPPRPRKAIAAVLLLVAVGVPAGLYVAQHPEVLERFASPAPAVSGEQPERAPLNAGETASAPAATPAPASPPIATPPSEVATPASAAPAGEPAAPAVAAREPPGESTPPPAAAPPVIAATPASRNAGAPAREGTQRNARARSESRPSPPPRTTERSGAACTPQVAALGLCNP